MLTELYRRGVWTGERAVNVIAAALLHPSQARTLGGGGVKGPLNARSASPFSS